MNSKIESLTLNELKAELKKGMPKSVEERKNWWKGAYSRFIYQNMYLTSPDIFCGLYYLISTSKMQSYFTLIVLAIKKVV